MKATAPSHSASAVAPWAGTGSSPEGISAALPGFSTRA